MFTFILFILAYECASIYEHTIRDDIREDLLCFVPNGVGSMAISPVFGLKHLTAQIPLDWDEAQTNAPGVSDLRKRFFKILSCSKPYEQLVDLEVDSFKTFSSLCPDNHDYECTLKSIIPICVFDEHIQNSAVYTGLCQKVLYFSPLKLYNLLMNSSERFPEIGFNITEPGIISNIGKSEKSPGSGYFSRFQNDDISLRLLKILFRTHFKTFWKLKYVSKCFNLETVVKLLFAVGEINLEDLIYFAKIAFGDSRRLCHMAHQQKNIFSCVLSETDKCKLISSYFNLEQNDLAVPIFISCAVEPLVISNYCSEASSESIVRTRLTLLLRYYSFLLSSIPNPAGIPKFQLDQIKQIFVELGKSKLYDYDICKPIRSICAHLRFLVDPEFMFLLDFHTDHDALIEYLIVHASIFI